MQGFFEFLSKKLSLLRTFVHGRFIAPANPLPRQRKIAPPLSFFPSSFRRREKSFCFSAYVPSKLRHFPWNIFTEFFPNKKFPRTAAFAAVRGNSFKFMKFLLSAQKKKCEPGIPFISLKEISWTKTLWKSQNHAFDFFPLRGERNGKGWICAIF